MIEARTHVIETKLEEAIDYTRDIKNSLKDDIIRIERITESTSTRMKDVQDDIDQRLREVSSLSRETEKDVRDSLRDLEDRVDVKMEKLDEELRDTLQKGIRQPTVRLGGNMSDEEIAKSGHHPADYNGDGNQLPTKRRNCI